MFRLILNLLLLSTALVGAVLAVRANFEQRPLEQIHERLRVEVGRQPISDPNKVHIRAVETNGPLDFRWNIYQPANFHAHWRYEMGSGGSGSSSRSGMSEPQTFAARVRIRQLPDGWYVWTKREGGSSLGGLGRPSWTKLLEDPSRLVIQQLGKDQTVVVDAQEIATLLKIEPSEAAVQQAEQDGRVPEVLLLWEFGAADAFEKRAQRRTSGVPDD